MRLELSLVLLALLIHPASCQSSIDNVTLEIDFQASTTYLGDEASAVTGSTVSKNFNQPFLSDNRPVALVGGSDPVEIEYIQGDPDTYRIVQKGGSFVFANTRGGVETVADRVSRVGEGLLNRIDPSFGFQPSSTSSIKVAYEFPYSVTKVSGDGGNVEEIGVRNRVLVDNSTELWVRLE